MARRGGAKGKAIKPGSLRHRGRLAHLPPGYSGRPLRRGLMSKTVAGFEIDGESFYPYWASATNHTWSDAAVVIAAARDMNLNTIRPTDWLNTALTADVQAASREESRWAKIDGLIAAASAVGMKVLLDLSTYRNLLEQRNAGVVTVNPYTVDWSPFLSWVINRTNTVSGVKYGADTTICYVAFGGEAEAPNGGGNTYGLTSAHLTSWAGNVLTYWRQNASVRHLLTIGGLLQLDWDSGIPYANMWGHQHCDIVAVHTYSDADLNVSLPLASSWAADNAKPWVNEEFGFAQSLGDSARAASFEEIYDKAELKGVAGTGFWNLGPELTGSSHDVNTSTPLVRDVVRAHATPTISHGGIVEKAYRYYRFRPTALRVGGTAIMQLSEFAMLKGLVRQSGMTASATNNSSPGGEEPDKAVDNSTATKWLTNNGVSSALILDFGSAKITTGYRWATGNDATERDPVSWVVEGSADNANWTVLDTRTNYATPTARRTFTADLDFV